MNAKPTRIDERDPVLTAHTKADEAPQQTAAEHTQLVVPRRARAKLVDDKLLHQE